MNERISLDRAYCVGVSRRSAQATASEILVQDPYVAARAGFEPTTLRSLAFDSTNEPPRSALIDDIKLYI